MIIKISLKVCKKIRTKNLFLNSFLPRALTLTESVLMFKPRIPEDFCLELLKNLTTSFLYEHTVLATGLKTCFFRVLSTISFGEGTTEFFAFIVRSLKFIFLEN